MVEQIDTTIKPTPKKIILTKWRERLEKARKRGEFTEREDHLSGEWMDCAYGERFKIDEEVDKKQFKKACDGNLREEKMENVNIEDMPMADPIYQKQMVENDVDFDEYILSKADTLGNNFTGAVAGNEFDKVEKIIKKIEKEPHMIRKRFRQETPLEKYEKNLKQQLEPV